MTNPFLNRITLAYLLLLTILFNGCKGSGVEEPPIEIDFTNGMFIATNDPAEFTFHYLGDEANNYAFNHIDIYSYVNNETLEGTIKDFVISEQYLFVLLSKENANQILKLDARSMKKLSSVDLDIHLAEKLLIYNNSAIICNGFSLFLVDLNTGNTLREFDRDAGNGFLSVEIHDNYLYYANELPYGRLTQVDLTSNQYIRTYNIGHTPNKIIFLADGHLIMTVERAANFFNPVFNPSEFLYPNIAPGIVKLNPFNSTLEQIAVSTFPYPKHISSENDLFCFVQFEEKFHPFDSSIQTWNQKNNVLSSNFKENFFIGENNGYKGMKTMKLKNSKLYVIVKNVFYVMEIESDGFEIAFSKKNAVKLVFTD